jgi:hypothetical protein
MTDGVHNILVFNDRIEYKNEKDEYHRIGGPALEFQDGTKIWCQDGLTHREDGPAFEYPDGARTWSVNGLIHRLDGPAVIWADGTKEWWIEGDWLTEDEFNSRLASI